MTEPNNKRAFPRAGLKLKGQVEIDGEVLPATIQDITVGGVAFVLDRPLPDGKDIIVKIDSGHSEVKSNSLKCRVVRNESLGSHHLIAVMLTEPNDEYLMDALAVVNGHRYNI